MWSNRLRKYYTMIKKTSALSQRIRNVLQRMHRHPLVLPVSVFMVLFFASLGLFITSGATTLGASDARVVKLSIDGVNQSLPTRARTVAELLERLNVTVSESDVIEPSLDTPIADNDFRINIYTARNVLIVDGDDRTYIETAEPTPQGVITEAGIEVEDEDIVEKDVSEPIDAFGVLEEGVISERIVIQRATPVMLSLFGVDYELRTHATTVEELLLERGVTLAEASVFPEPGDAIEDEMAVFVTDPDKEIVMEEQEIPQPEETVDDFDLLIGEREVRTEGRPGQKIIVYEITEDGSRTTLQEVIVRQPTTRVIANGRQVPTISDPSANVQLGRQLAGDRGWDGEQFACLYQLWQRESGWSHTANNRSSGAYGIPQALPGSKMATVAGDWQTNPATQITWGLNYIQGRYGNPCGAYSFFQSANWY